MTLLWLLLVAVCMGSAASAHGRCARTLIPPIATFPAHIPICRIFIQATGLPIPATHGAIVPSRILPPLILLPMPLNGTLIIWIKADPAFRIFAYPSSFLRIICRCAC